jgi:hypothetical protein
MEEDGSSMITSLNNKMVDLTTSRNSAAKVVQTYPFDSSDNLRTCQSVHFANDLNRAHS